MVDETHAGLPESRTLAIRTRDGHDFELIYQPPSGPARALLYWLPAMGVPARHYRHLAAQLAAHGMAVALHEWRGIGSSACRAGRRSDWSYAQLLEEDIAAGLARARLFESSVPHVLGGHSLGGQLSVIYASLFPGQVDGLLLIASGAPYWRHFRRAWAVRLLYILAPSIAGLFGYFPGRSLGFGGNEARGVISDWARSGRHGVYLDPASGQSLVPAMAGLAVPLLALVLDQDWLAPEASLAHLLAPLDQAAGRIRVLDAPTLGLARADHFSWMEQPQVLVQIIEEWLAAAFSDTADGRRRRLP
ncbi:alpha/beta hydrolase family protein [Frateuria aurantia]